MLKTRLVALCCAFPLWELPDGLRSMRSMRSSGRSLKRKGHMESIAAACWRKALCSFQASWQQVTPSHSSLEPRLEIIRLEYIPIQLFGLQSNAWLLHESPADTSIMSYGSYGTGCRWHAVGTRMHSQGTMMAVVAYTIWLGIDAASQTTKLDGIHRIPTDLRMWSVFSAFFQARVTRSTKDWNPVHSLHDSEPIFQIVENLFCVTCF